MKKYDVAAYVWPSYTGKEPRSRIFWPQGIGEWETVIKATPKFDGHKWPRKPLWGYMDEADPLVMEKQIDAAVSYGVNTFIYDWYWYDRRPFLENCLNDGFLKAKNNTKMKFYLMWANHDGITHMWDGRNPDVDCPVWEGSQDRKEFEIIVKRIIEKYFSRENYYKIDGKPVFSIYAACNFCKGFGDIDKARDALEYFRRETEKAGHKGLHLQIVLGDGPKYPIPVSHGGKGNSDAVAGLGFDSATQYQFAVYNKPESTGDYDDIISNRLPSWWESMDKELSVPFFPQVSVGWDNNLRYGKLQLPVFVNNTPSNIERALRAAKNYIDRHPSRTPLVTINSWNEWTEGSYLQPDDLYGYGYLEAVKKVFGGNN